MRRLIRLLLSLGPYRGWVHAMLAMVLAASVAVVAAGILVFWPGAIPVPAFAAAAWAATGAVGLLRPARRASVWLANGLLGTGLPGPARPRRLATAAWLLSWTAAGGALAAASSLAVFTLGLPAVWLGGGGEVAFAVPVRIPPGAAGSWTVAVAVAALIAVVFLSAAYASLMRPLARRLVGPGLAERLVAAEAEADRAAARNHLARDLHDSIGHTLTASTIQAAVARQILGSDPDSARLAMSAIEDSSRAALEDLDRALGALRGEPASPRPEPTLADLDTLRDRIDLTGTELTVDIDGATASLPLSLSQEAYRIVQEGVTNALRHAPGATIRLTVRTTESQLEVRVANRVRRPARSGAGRGLTGITERARLLGGTVTAGPDGASDWLLQASLPLVPTRPIVR